MFIASMKDVDCKILAAANLVFFSGFWNLVKMIFIFILKYFKYILEWIWQLPYFQSLSGKEFGYCQIGEYWLQAFVNCQLYGLSQVFKTLPKWSIYNFSGLNTFLIFSGVFWLGIFHFSNLIKSLCEYITKAKLSCCGILLEQTIK